MYQSLMITMCPVRQHHNWINSLCSYIVPVHIISNIYYTYNNIKEWSGTGIWRVKRYYNFLSLSIFLIVWFFTSREFSGLIQMSYVIGIIVKCRVLRGQGLIINDNTFSSIIINGYFFTTNISTRRIRFLQKFRWTSCCTWCCQVSMYHSPKSSCGNFRSNIGRTWLQIHLCIFI